MKEEKEYCKDKYLELLEFERDMETRKSLAQQKIQERSKEIQAEIVSKANKERKDDMVKQQEKLSIADQIEKASMEGNLELVNQLFEKMKEL